DGRRDGSGRRRTAFAELRGGPAADEPGPREALSQDIPVDALIDDHDVDVLTEGAPGGGGTGPHLRQREVEVAEQREASLLRAPDIGKAGRKIDRDAHLAHR